MSACVNEYLDLHLHRNILLPYTHTQSWFVIIGLFSGISIGIHFWCCPVELCLCVQCTI